MLDATPRNIKKRKRFRRLAGLRFQITQSKFQNIFLKILTFFRRISEHSLVALENQSLLLIGGYDYGNGGGSQSGIWQLKDENWNQIGELLQV